MTLDQQDKYRDKQDAETYASDQKENRGTYGTITSITDIGEGMRVCLDVADLLKADEGIYVGNTGHGYLFIYGETRETETYPPRPFRMNCGAIHQYVLQGEETVYVADLEPGQHVQIYNLIGQFRFVPIGRMKIEKRPLLRIEVELEDGDCISATLQASESVHLLEKERGVYPILKLKPGFRVYCVKDQPGRHLGKKVEEEIIEK